MMKGWRKQLHYITFLLTFFVSSSFATTLPNSTEVYFNHNNHKNYQDPLRHFPREGDNLEEVLISKIKSARSRVWIAVFDLDLEGVAQALIEQHRKGIDIRLVVERQESLSFSHSFYVAPLKGKRSSPAMVALEKAGVPLKDDSLVEGGSGLMHHKFMVLDDAQVVTGSANYTSSDIHGDLENPATRGNVNSLLVFQSPQLNQIFAQEFSLLWGSGRADDGRFGRKKPARPAQSVWIGKSKITVQFSPVMPADPKMQELRPETTIDMIANTLSKAEQKIDFSLFVFSHQKLADIMEEAANRKGTQIRGLIDSGFIYRDFSEALDMFGVEMPNNHCNIEEDNNPWSRPISSVGTPSLPKGDKLHHKFAVIDNRTVITGSHNWSDAAEQRNDETLLIIEDPALAQSYSEEFQRVSQIRPYWGAGPRLQGIIRERTQECGK